LFVRATFLAVQVFSQALLAAHGLHNDRPGHLNCQPRCDRPLSTQTNDRGIKIMKPLSGKVALVTSSGQIALKLASQGASLVVHYASSRAGAEAVVEKIHDQGGEALAYQADIAKRGNVQRLFEQIDQSPGRIDIVANSSGVSGGGTLPDLDFEAASPFGRIGRAEEIANVVAFLAGPEASWVSGTHFDL